LLISCHHHLSIILYHITIATKHQQDVFRSSQSLIRLNMVKTKGRFDGLDVGAMVSHLNRVALSRRVINIYNGPTGDTYLFKLDKPSGEDGNLMLILESGVRFHTTQLSYANPGMPTPFCAKLRKHIRGLRLERVEQLGHFDRVIHLVFGSGDSQRHSLVLELYARGNLIMCNSKFEILSLLRSHEYENVKVQVGHVYPITYATTTSTTTTSEEGNDDNTSTNTNDSTLLSAKYPMVWFQNQQEQEQSPQAIDSTSDGNKKKGGRGSGELPLKGLLLKPTSGVSHYGPSLLDHCLLCADLEKKQPSQLSLEDWNRLQSKLQQEGDRILKSLELADKKGYILYQPKAAATPSDEQSKQPSFLPPSPFDDKYLVEFQPHLLKQHESLPHLEYESFDRAVDDFFGHLESQKQMQRAETQQNQAESRLEKIKSDHQQRVDDLVKQQEVMKEHAQLVLKHADMVEKAIQVVNSALNSGMDWEQLENLVELEQTQNRNPVALLIHELKFAQDTMVLRLPTERCDDDDGDGEEEEAKPRTIDITISLKETAHGNSSALFAKYRASKEKSQKTMEASTKVLQGAEETARRQLEDAQKRTTNVSQAIHTKRRQLWFEKFHWFITSDNYLVIAGRDAQQNELLVKRYLRPGDAYLHADVHGAASCILRAKRSRQEQGGKTTALPLSDQALREAGNFTICKSSAWNSRMVTSAWWVESHQVSKTAPTGEYLTVGSFMIRGKKNFLPPTQLEMGFGVLFRLGDDDSVARHKNERRDFALMELEQQDDDLFLHEQVPTSKPERPIAKTAPPLETKEAQTSEKATASDDAENDEMEPVPDNHEGVLNGVDTSKISKDENQPDKTEDEEEEESEDRSNDPDVPNGASEEGDGGQNNEPGFEPKKKKGLSVRERKMIRKFGSSEAAMVAENERKKNEGQKDVSVALLSNTTSVEASSNAIPKRRNKAKMKRMVTKYADQDDEDRELALLALHAGEKSKRPDKKKVPVTSESEQKAASETLAILKKDSAKFAMELPDEVREILAECVVVKSGNDEPTVRWDKFDADVLEQLQSFESEEKLAAAKRLLNLKQSTRVDNFSASLLGIIRTIKKYGHKNLDTNTSGGPEDAKRKTKAEKEAETAAWKQTLAEEGIVKEEGEEDDVDDTVELAKLTGKPHPDDLILFAVPVCAPYATLSQYSYRVKLAPGSQKRGKASKQCVEIFLKEGVKSAATDRDRDSIKRVSDNEWVQAMCGDVKISAAGASKTTKSQKGKNQSKGKKKK
jgi:predicted ribosome quality control (RQC) complex YloA/Tae2 family protein